MQKIDKERRFEDSSKLLSSSNMSASLNNSTLKRDRDKDIDLIIQRNEERKHMRNNSGLELKRSLIA